MMPRISIIITTYNRLQQVQEAVASIVPQLRDDDELLVVDNGFSAAEHDELANALGRQGARLLREPHPGISFARNLGARAASGEVIAFLDDDAIASPTWIEEIRRGFDAGGCQCLGGPVLLPAELPKPSWFPPQYSYVFGEVDLGPQAFDMSGRCLPMGANIAFRRDAFLKAGMFPLSMGRTGTNFAGGEETFLCRKILQQGGRIRYLPEMAVTHRVSPARLTMQHLYRNAYGTGQSDGRVELAISGRAAFRLRAALKLARIVVELPGALWRRARGDARAWAEHRIRVTLFRGYVSLPPRSLDQIRE